MKIKHIALIGYQQDIDKFKDHIQQQYSNEIVIQFISYLDNGLSYTLDFLNQTDEVVILNPADKEINIRKIVLALSKSKCPIKIIPMSEKFLLDYQKARDVQVEDILFCPIKNNHNQDLTNIYQNKTILVFGGAGSIGSEIVFQLLGLGAKKVIVYDNTEYFVYKIDQNLQEKGISHDRYQLIIGNVLNKSKVEHIIKRQRLDFVFYLAAYKHVYLMEENIDEAIINNLEGIRNIVDICVENNIPNLVFISTDKVVNPTTVMGATKKLSEIYIQQKDKKNTKINIVRFGNVINSRGSVLPLFEHQIQKKLPLTITDPKVERFFMSIPQAAFLVLQCQLHKMENSVFILNMGESVLIEDIARCLIRIHNLIPQIDIPIHYIGLKKGEKIQEILWTDEEFNNMIPLDDGLIYRLKKITSFDLDVQTIFNHLINLAKNESSSEKLRQALLELFPTISY